MARDLAKKVRLDRAAFIVVDVQNDFCHPEGSLARRGGDLTMIEAAVDRTQAFLAEARRVGLPIIFVRTEHGPWTDCSTWLGRHKNRDEEPIPVCVDGTWGAEFYKVSPLPGEKVVIKHRYSAFIGTDLDLILRSRGIQTIIMSGVATNVCVESTARDGYMLNYHVVFLSDCTGAVKEEVHRATLYTMDKHFGDVASSDEVVAAWAAIGPVR